MWRLATSLQNASRARNPSTTLSAWSCVSTRENGVTSRKFTGYSHQAFSNFHTSIPLAASNVVQFPLAQTGEGIKECELTEWYVEQGSRVEEFQKICEVQSDKAAVEITSRYAGMIKKRHHTVGDVVQVGSPLVDIEVTEETSTQDGAAVQTETVPPTPSEVDDAPVASVRQKSPPGYKVFASPATKHLAKENSINLAAVTGTGPEGRITREDVLLVLEQQAHSAVSKQPSPASSEVPSAPSTSSQHPSAASVSPVSSPGTVPDPSPPTEGAAPKSLHSDSTIIPLRGYKRAMVKSMVAAGAIPHFHLCDELDMRAMMSLRHRIKDDSVLQGVHLTFLPIMIKALSAALEEFPIVNSSLNDKADALLQHSSHNIGVAMATPSGLVVPNIKNVQHRNVASIAAELVRLQKDAAIGRVNQSDVMGGTVSISNIGTIGGTYATPLVNSPEIAIVALGKVRHLPRFATDGEVEKAALMNISWGADHRVLDGATLAEFSNKWKQYIEQPDMLLLRLT
ncbi:hypothetical protein WJX77_012471 [Trebouxia sp. C0004]